MKLIGSMLALFTLMLLSLPCASQETTAPTETSAVRTTIQNYIESYYTGDPARMERSLHPQYLKHVMSGQQGNLKMFQKTGLQMVQEVQSAGRKASSANMKEEITVLDVNGDIASAKLVTSGWVDYLVLSKWNGEWKDSLCANAKKLTLQLPPSDGPHNVLFHCVGKFIPCGSPKLVTKFVNTPIFVKSR